MGTTKSRKSSSKARICRNIFYLVLIAFASFAIFCFDKDNAIRSNYFAFLNNNFIVDLTTLLGIERYDITSKVWLLYLIIITVLTVIVLGNLIAPAIVDKKVKNNPNLFATEGKTRTWYTLVFYGVFGAIAAAILAIVVLFDVFALYGDNSTKISSIINLLTLLAFCLVFAVTLLIIVMLIVLVRTDKVNQPKESDSKPVAEIVEEPAAAVETEPEAETVEDDNSVEPINEKPVIVIDTVSEEKEATPEEDEASSEEDDEIPEEDEVTSEEDEASSEEDDEIPEEDEVTSEEDESELSPAMRRAVQKSFTGKMSQATKEQKVYYGELKNYMLSFKGVNSRVSWNYDSFNIGRKKAVKIAFRGQTLVAYLALDPKEYAETKYYPHDMSNTSRFAETPMMVKIKSERGVKFAKELMDKVCEGLAPKKNFVAEQYSFPYMSNKKLVENGLAKEVTVTVFTPNK